MPSHQPLPLALTLTRCAAAECESVYDLMDLEDAERNELLAGLSSAQLADVARVCNRYPNIDVSYEVEDADEVASGDTVTVLVNLQREGDEEGRVPKVPGRCGEM